MKLWQKILIAMGLAIFVGIFISPDAEVIEYVIGPTLLSWIQSLILPFVPAFKPVGEIFLSLINMIIVLLVLSSMTVGITSIHDPQKLGRVGLKTLMVYLVTTLFAIVIGLAVAYFFQPGSGLSLVSTGSFVVQQPPTWSEIILNIVPTNPMASLVKGEVLQIIVFSLFLGVSINFAGEKGRPLLELMESLADVMYRLTSIVMEFSPIGVFAIMADLVSRYGVAGLLPLGKFLVLYYAACAVHVVVVFCAGLWIFARLHPWPFFKGMVDAIMVAFSTSSSSATLPVSMHCVQQNLGVSKNITRFVLPLGSTVNMNGAAIYQGMSALFIAQAYGIELEWYSVITIVLTATLSAIGAAGIPGSGFIMLSVVFKSAGLPAGEGLALLAGIDRVREMGSTVLNVLGDAIAAVYVAKQEGELDERQYYHEELVEMEGGEI